MVAPSDGFEDGTRSDAVADVAGGPREASGRAFASITARRGARGSVELTRNGVVGAERRRAHVWRVARTSFESRRAGLHSRVLKSWDELTRGAHLRAGRAVSHTLFPARRYVRRPPGRRLAPRVDGSSRFARARKFNRESSRVFLFTRPASSRGVAPRAQDRGGDPRVSRAVADGRRVHPPLASLARVPPDGQGARAREHRPQHRLGFDPDADDAVRPDAALAPRRAVERAAELTAENARLRSLLDESDARAARAEARLRDALDPSLVAYRAAADGALDLDLVTRDAAASLQREIQSQDAILREYQRENEAAAATLADAKRLAADVESKLRAELADAADESARLRIRLEAAGGSSATLEPSADAGDASTPSSATEANARHAGTRNKPPSAMAEALARHLEAEKRAASREAELRDALESTRAELREAENGASLDALRIALEEERARREAETSELAALRERVEWFTENQRLTTDADETARRRAATVESLERRLARADRELAKLKGFGFGKRAGKNATRTTDTSDANAEESALSRRDRYAGGTLERKSRRTKRDDVDVANATSSASTSSAKATPADPRDQSSAGVAALLGGGSSFSSTPFPPDVDVGGSAAFDAGLARRPDSVAALVRAVRPTEDHAGKMAELEARCRRLRDELDAADAARERALRALQVEHLRLKSGMEKRVAAAEAAEATAKKRAATAARLERETRELRGALERRTTKANAERKRADAAERRLRERGGDVVDDAKTERRGGDAGDGRGTKTRG